MKYNELTAHQILDLIKEKKTSAKEVTEACLSQITKVDENINSFVRLMDNTLDSLTTESTTKFPIPTAIKDNMCMKNREITCSSHILEGFISPYDATVVKKLKDSGAILIGNANMDEFAFGSSCENSAFYKKQDSLKKKIKAGACVNPWDLERVPGGSSGGSAASVAAGEAICALGSDTGALWEKPAHTGAQNDLTHFDATVLLQINHLQNSRTVTGHDALGTAVCRQGAHARQCAHLCAVSCRVMDIPVHPADDYHYFFNLWHHRSEFVRAVHRFAI